MKKWILIIVIGGLSGSASAQELSYSFGRMGAGSEGSTYAWQIDYRQNFLRYMAFSASWINEGHIEGHHRDGYAGELWGLYPLFNHKMTVGAGGGFYRYYDTQPDPANSNDSLDVHGWAPIASLSASYYTATPWFFRFTVNWLMPHDNVQTRTAVLGVGYRLWATSEDKSQGPPGSKTESIVRQKGNEFTFALGKTVVNTLNSQDDTAFSLEFRKEFARYADWTVSFINEGDPQLIKRGGFAGQVWLTDVFLDQQLEIGFGAGPYVFVDRKASEDNRSDITGIVGPTIAYRFKKNWVVRLNWNRVITGYNRDTDLFLLGLGYRWGAHASESPDKTKVQ